MHPENVGQLSSEFAQTCRAPRHGKCAHDEVHLYSPQQAQRFLENSEAIEGPELCCKTTQLGESVIGRPVHSQENLAFTFSPFTTCVLPSASNGMRPGRAGTLVPLMNVNTPMCEEASMLSAGIYDRQPNCTGSDQRLLQRGRVWRGASEVCCDAHQLVGATSNAVMQGETADPASATYCFLPHAMLVD